MKRKNIQELSNSNEVSNNVKRLKKTDQHEEEKDGYVENEEFEYEYDSKEEEEDEEEEEGDEGSGNWNFVGPLSIQNEKKQWILHKFGIDTSLKILKSLTVSDFIIDLKNILSIQRTSGLWPGIEITFQDSTSNLAAPQKIKFHTESEEEYKIWLNFFKLCQTC